MENLKWKIGVALSSSICKDMNHPYVSLSFQIRENNGTLTHHNVELSYDDFMVMKIDS